jgi:hypothetical protein
VIVNLKRETISNGNPLHHLLHLLSIIVDVKNAKKEEINAIAMTLGEKFCFAKKNPRLTGVFYYI